MIPTSFAVLVGLLPSLAPRKLACRPESPVVPRPTSLAASSTFGDATARLEEAFNSALSRESTAGWDVHNTSFSLALVSHDQPDPATPVWEFHHLAEGNVAGTKSLDRHSQYLIGSVTKALSNYILLESGVDLDAPVTDFVPALATDNSTIQWREVTLRALAEHLSGTPQNCE
jgi:CubicO group peptidase (beta-lactamase class C family)